jgi:hypothetical protein
MEEVITQEQADKATLEAGLKIYSTQELEEMRVKSVKVCNRIFIKLLTDIIENAENKPFTGDIEDEYIKNIFFKTYQFAVEENATYYDIETLKDYPLVLSKVINLFDNALHSDKTKILYKVFGVNDTNLLPITKIRDLETQQDLERLFEEIKKDLKKTRSGIK